MADALANYIVDVPIHTKINDIRQKVTDMPKEKLVERIQATTTELVKLQYMMREYSVLEWYEKLGDRQKDLHDFFEKHVGDIKAQAGSNYNWVVLSDKEFKSEKHIKEIKRFDEDIDVWVGFLTTSKKVEKATKDYSDLKLQGMLFTPLFSVSK
jgi:hypothetical protein